MNWKSILLRKDWKHNKLQNILSVISILLGVAVLIATVITVTSAKQAFLKLLDSQNSGANLLASSVNEEQIKTAAFKYQSTDIKDAFPFYSADCYFENGGTYHEVYEMAVDFSKESEYGGYKLLSGSTPKNGECLIPEAMETQFRLNTGDTVTVRTESGKADFKISGIASNTGIANANLGTCILTDYRNMPGSGSITYKLMFKDGADVKAEKASLQTALKGKYTVDFPEGQGEQELNQVNQLFSLMMVFGFLTLLLGGFLINVTVNEFVRKMRQKIAVLKVLGAAQKNIVHLVLEKSLILGLFGAVPGVAAGIFGSFGLIRLVSSVFVDGMDIQPVVKIPAAVAIAVGAIVFCLAVSLPAAFRAAKESIVSGFRMYDKTSKAGVKKFIVIVAILIALVCGRLLTGESPVAKFFTYAAVLTAVYLISLVAFIPFSRLILKFVNRISAFNGFTVKNNLVKQSGKTINLSALFSFVIAISVAITLVVGEISDSINRMENGRFFGDAVVSTLTGEGLSKDVLAKICSANGVEKAYPIYQKDISIGSDSVRVQGFCLDAENENRLSGDWMIDKNSLQKLSDPDTVLLSSLVLSDNHLKTGDNITLGSGTSAKVLKIVGTFSSMSNDGKCAILSDRCFTDTFSDYSLRAVNIVKNSNISFNTLKSNISSAVNDDFIQVNGSDDVAQSQIKQDSQFILLINSMIFLLVLASILMLINSISMNIKNNSYSLAVTKLIGATSRNLIVQSSIEGILYGVFGAAAGTAAGIVLNFIMTSKMNSMDTWNLRMSVPAHTLIKGGIGFILVALLAEIIATVLNYKSNYKTVLAEE